jgi:hypothetical protein
MVKPASGEYHSIFQQRSPSCAACLLTQRERRDPYGGYDDKILHRQDFNSRTAEDPAIVEL